MQKQQHVQILTCHLYHLEVFYLQEKYVDFAYWKIYIHLNKLISNIFRPILLCFKFVGKKCPTWSWW